MPDVLKLMSAKEYRRPITGFQPKGRKKIFRCLTSVFFEDKTALLALAAPARCEHLSLSLRSARLEDTVTWYTRHCTHWQWLHQKR